MKIVTYTATPGLERFSERERFTVWRSIHKRLMREDDAYRDKVRGFRCRLILTSEWSGIVPTALILIVCFVVLPAVRERQALFELSIALIIVITLASIVYGIISVLRDVGGSVEMQKFMNERIGRELHKAYGFPAA